MRTALLAPLLPLALAAAAAGADLKPIDAFEANSDSWKYIGGEEFPGAKGKLTCDPDVFIEGHHSYRLDADFNHGGAYVGLWRDSAGIKTDIKALHVWVRSFNINSLGVRLADGGGQTHQGAVALTPVKTKDGATPKDWHELIIRPSDIVGGEHWGGANDGKWRGPCVGIGFNIGNKAVVNDALHGGTVWIDAMSYEPVGQ